jgi:ankyrin repeat protein
LDAAFRAGDLETIRDELGAVEGFPNVEAHPAMGSCLTYSIYHGPLSLVAAFLDAGADANAPADDGFPPLIAAVTCLRAPPGGRSRPDVPALVTLLLDHGADVGQRGYNDFTALHEAALQGDLETVDLLLARGANPNAVTRIDDPETPLEVAVRAGHAAVIERLRPLTTRLAWEAAVRDGDARAIRRLLATGEQIDLRDAYQQTALMRCSHAGHTEVVEALIAAGADLDQTAKYHLSALMLAVIAGHHRIARLLVRAGADTTIRGTGAPGFHDKTAADLAADRGDASLSKYIATHRRSGRSR